MQAMRIAHYKLVEGTFSELAEQARDGMLEVFKTQPGFIRYGLVDTGQGHCASISLWDTLADAEAATPVAAAWVQEHLGDRLELRSNEVGELAFFEGVTAAV